jgi:hypothetical protein
VWEEQHRWDPHITALLIDYLAKAKAVHASQDAADAAAAAAEAARLAAEAAARDARSRSAGDSGGGSGSRAGGVAPPVVTFTMMTHVPQVYANGDYSPGCGGALAYQQIATHQGYQMIFLDPGYAYDYSTFPTADSWGVNVYSC